MKVVTDSKYYDEIARTIEVYGDDKAGQKFSPSIMAQELSNSCIHQYDLGIADGQTIGREAQNKEFWSKYLSVMKSGGDAYYLFAGPAWNSKTFYPTEDIVPTGTCHYMFQQFSWYIAPYIDLAQRLEECGVTLDTSQNKGFALFFNHCFVYRLPKISVISAVSLDRTFSGARVLHTIDELEFRADGKNTFSNTFGDCGELANITKISGVIGNSVSFSGCPKLTSATVDNIVGALKNLTPEDGAKTLTLHATVKANMTATQIATIQTKGWTLA